MFISSSACKPLALPAILWSGDAIVQHSDGAPDEWVRDVHVDPGPPKMACHKPNFADKVRRHDKAQEGTDGKTEK